MRAGNTWTEARYWGFIRSALRKASVKYPPRNQCLKNARRNYTGDNKRQKYEYQCNICNNWFKQTHVQVDHIIPCGSLKCADDLAGFVSRLYCEPEDLQVLCKKCHKDKK